MHTTPHPLDYLVNEVNQNLQALFDKQAENHQLMVNAQDELFAKLHQPKTVIRGIDGKIIGIK